MNALESGVVIYANSERAGNRDSELKSYPQSYPQKGHAGRRFRRGSILVRPTKSTTFSDIRYYSRPILTNRVLNKDPIHGNNFLIYKTEGRLVPRRGP